MTSKICALCLVFFVLSSMAIANNVTADDEPGRIQTRLAQAIENATGEGQWPCVFSGQFQQQRILSGTKISVNSSGIFFHVCESGMLWETQSPVLESLVYTDVGQHARFRPGKGKEVLSGVVQSRVAELLLALMGGDTAELEQKFLLDEEHSDENLLVLEPRDAAVKLQLQSLEIATEADQMSLLMSASNGGDIMMTLREFAAPTQSPVIVCSSISVQAASVCKHLFDSQSQ